MSKPSIEELVVKKVASHFDGKKAHFTVDGILEHYPNAFMHESDMYELEVEEDGETVSKKFISIDDVDFIENEALEELVEDFIPETKLDELPPVKTEETAEVNKTGAVISEAGEGGLPTIAEAVVNPSPYPPTEPEIIVNDIPVVVEEVKKEETPVTPEPIAPKPAKKKVAKK